MSWNKPTNSSQESPSQRSRNKAFGKKTFWLFLIVVVCAFIVYLVLPDDGPQTSGNTTANHTNGKKNEKPISQNTNIVVKSTAAEETKTDDGVKYSQTYPGEKLISVSTNSSGYIVERTIDAQGRPWQHFREPPSKWKHSTDAIIAQVMFAPEGIQAPPLPPMSQSADLEFMRSMKSPIEILPDDSSDVIAQKELVKSVREQIKERIDSGEHFCDIINDHRTFINDRTETRAIGRSLINELIKKGESHEKIEAALKTVNSAYKKFDIDQIIVVGNKVVEIK